MKAERRDTQRHFPPLQSTFCRFAICNLHSAIVRSSVAHVMTFVNLSLLAGAVLIAVPIVLHLIMRRKPTRLEFPALRFIQTAGWTPTGEDCNCGTCCCCCCGRE